MDPVNLHQQKNHQKLQKVCFSFDLKLFIFLPWNLETKERIQKYNDLAATLGKVTVAKLKEILKKNGQKMSGTKAEVTLRVGGILLLLKLLWFYLFDFRGYG